MRPGSPKADKRGDLAPFRGANQSYSRLPDAKSASTHSRRRSPRTMGDPAGFLPPTPLQDMRHTTHIGPRVLVKVRDPDGRLPLEEVRPATVNAQQGKRNQRQRNKDPKRSQIPESSIRSQHIFRPKSTNHTQNQRINKRQDMVKSNSVKTMPSRLTRFFKRNQSERNMITKEKEMRSNSVHQVQKSQDAKRYEQLLAEARFLEFERQRKQEKKLQREMLAQTVVGATVEVPARDHTNESFCSSVSFMDDATAPEQVSPLVNDALAKAMGHQALILESGDLIWHLRKVNEEHQKNYLRLQEENRKLLEAKKCFDTLRSHATELTEENKKLLEEVSRYKKEVERIRADPEPSKTANRRSSPRPRRLVNV